MALNPTCSEAVFRLGGKMLKLSADSRSELEWFVEWLKTADDGELDGCEIHIGGGGLFYVLANLVKARRQLGRETFSKIPIDKAWEAGNWVIAVVVGKECHLPQSREELFLALLREGKEAEVAVLEPEAEEICRLFKEWKRGEMTREQFRGKALALLLLEAGR